MVNSTYKDEPDSEYYYCYYYDENYNKITGVSKIDESNLKKLSSDMGIQYVHMEKETDIKNKLTEIKRTITNSQDIEQKISSYQDIYYYFSIPLVLLLMSNFILQKRRML